LDAFIDSLTVCPSKVSDVSLSFPGALPLPRYTGCEGRGHRFQTVAFQSNLFLLVSDAFCWIHNVSTNIIVKRPTRFSALIDDTKYTRTWKSREKGSGCYKQNKLQGREEYNKTK